MTYTHTYVTLAVSPAAFEEIREKLQAAGYGDQFHSDREDGLVIDMHGLALVREDLKQKERAMPFTDADLTNLFTYHAPKGDQLERYQAIRSAALEFAKVIVANTPSSADQTAAIRLLRECVFTANASIALE